MNWMRQTPAAKSTSAKIPVLDPSEVAMERKASAMVWLNDICKEPQWEELSVWERSDVLVAVTPNMDHFERRHFEDRCQ
jgi:hypothetical protein